jgi:hypothetical protein
MHASVAVEKMQERMHGLPSFLPIVHVSIHQCQLERAWPLYLPSYSLRPRLFCIQNLFHNKKISYFSIRILSLSLFHYYLLSNSLLLLNSCANTQTVLLSDTE